MSDLRSRCLTAMTEAMVDEAPAMFDDYAAAGLDALIVVLVEHADETLHPKYNDEANPWRLFDAPVEDLLFALKPTTEEAR